MWLKHTGINKQLDFSTMGSKMWMHIDETKIHEPNASYEIVLVWSHHSNNGKWQVEFCSANWQGSQQLEDNGNVDHLENMED